MLHAYSATPSLSLNGTRKSVAKLSNKRFPFIVINRESRRDVFVFSFLIKEM